MTGSLKENLSQLERVLHMRINKDVNLRRFQFLQWQAALLFMEGMASGEQLQEYILEPCLQAAQKAEWAGTAQQLLEAHVLQTGAMRSVNDLREAAQALVDGQAILLVDSMAAIIVMDVRGYVRRGISQPVVESVVMGSHEAFNESIRDNITLIRRMVHSTDLIGEMRKIGDQTPSNLCLMYLAGIAPEETIREVKRRLDGCRVDYVANLGVLEQLMEDSPYALLPQVCLTERPDRAASFLMEGQVLLLMDGSPQALCLPINFLHLFHAPDDTFMRWQLGSFMRLIRLIGAAAALLLPGIFTALTMYHPEAVPLTLLTAMLESQSSAPLSVLGESFLMLIAFDLINEAGVRVPGAGGGTLGIVSGLILGQAAVDAKLINPLLIIVVALSGLGTYVIPDYKLSMAFRVLQLLFLAAGGLGGFYGLVGFSVVCLTALCGMTSLGQPFMAPLTPARPGNPDGFWRGPVWRQRLRTYLADPNSMLRARGRMRRWDEGEE